MKIVYHKPDDVKEFDIEKYYKSLNRYGEVDKAKIKEALSILHYDPMHYSVLVRVGVELLPDENSAREYYEAHRPSGDGEFERLRRITGYLVGSLERWNDGKKAEEADRVKHDVYSPENKDKIEALKEQLVEEEANSCKGKM